MAAILVFAKSNPSGFAILWRYFAWSNQTLSLFAFLAITVWMFENGKSKYVWVPLIPGAFYAFITMAYIANAKIGFGLPMETSTIIGVAFTVAATVLFFLKIRLSETAIEIEDALVKEQR